MSPETYISDVAHAIQLAVAPVFLLTGVGALLAVLTSRLARIVDRARQLEGLLAQADEAGRDRLLAELRVLSRRARYVNLAVTLATFCALLVCTVIVLLFFGAYSEARVVRTVGIIFIVAMFTLIAALLVFLREIFTATRHLRIGPH
ncbi:MAG TPA: DUF2721 domain-containing protein [Gammaproteobacteria bacterium]|nr:DUF2721 domain-containing protein [Gammaproteobacteria bacterium]